MFIGLHNNHYSSRTLPQGELKLNRRAGHFLQNLMCCYVPSQTDRDLTGFGPTLKTTTSVVDYATKIAPTQIGPGILSYAKKCGVFGAAPQFKPLLTTKGSLFACMAPNAGSRGGLPCIFGLTTPAPTGCLWYFALMYYYSLFGGTVQNTYNSDGDVLNPTIAFTNFFIGMTFDIQPDGNHVTMYIDGQITTQLFSKTTPLDYSSGDPTVTIGGFPGDTNRYSGTNLVLGAMWNRVLSTQEMLELYARPFLLVNQQTSRIIYTRKAVVTAKQRPRIRMIA